MRDARSYGDHDLERKREQTRFFRLTMRIESSRRFFTLIVFYARARARQGNMRAGSRI